ncbi:MAG: CoA pyrophosphatase [Actinomycetota bacterium]
MTAPSPPGRLRPDDIAAVLGPTRGATAIDGDATTSDRRRAAVAAVFAPGAEGTELLFIQRATVDRDPWSGQMAFPGGRVEAGDADTIATAVRETGEELGLDIGGALHLGPLADVDGGRGTDRSIVVSAHCFWLDRPQPLHPNYEVAAGLWLPFDQLLDRRRYIDYLYPPAGARFPGIQLDEPSQVIWGLTLRLLADLMERLDHPFIV